MTGTYNTGVFRDALSDPTQDVREMPIEVSREVIQVAVQNSAVMQLATVQPMPTRQASVPVLSAYPTAYWLSGANQSAKESSFKQTTTVDWSSYTMRAEEMAVLIPIPDAYIQDTGVDLFNEVKPLIGQAFGQLIDQAVLFGVNNPWLGQSGSLYAQAVAKGNTVTAGAISGQDLAGDIADVAVLLEDDGYDFNGLASYKSFRWKLNKLRSTTGEPIYQPSLAQGELATIYGEPYASVNNGTWDKTKAYLLAGDWQYVRFGVRQDMTFSISDSAVIVDPDNNNKVVYSAFQQDGKVLRCVMRVAFVCAFPLVTPLNTSNPYPFAVLRPSGAAPS